MLRTYLFLALTALLPATEPALFRKDNLLAWCIVPFDAKKRGPEERAAMLAALGLRHYAYDFRAEHVPQFDAEIEAAKKYGVSLDAWWFPTQMNDSARHILSVIKKHGISPQLWVMGGGDWPHGAKVEPRYQAEVERLLPLAQAAAAQGLKVALYNHGGWFGEPETQLEIIARLQQRGLTNVGIVYNLHHGHAHLHRFAELLKKMQPHLLCLCINGMTENGEARGRKIMPVGQGEWDARLLKMIQESRYKGLIGILNHTEEDAEARLRDNLEGLEWLLSPADKAKPTPRTTTGMTERSEPAAEAGPRGEASRSELFGQALRGSMTEAAQESFRTRPFTVECQARLDSKLGFNILVACDPKRSVTHWELFTQKGTGQLSFFQPARGGNFTSGKDVCDGQWHHLAASVSETEVVLYVDGAEVLRKAALPLGKGEVVKGQLGLGQLAEGGLRCAGLLDQVRLRSGAHAPQAPLHEPAKKDAATLGLWDFENLSAAAPPQRSAEVTPSFYQHAPLRPTDYPLASESVNRYRLYDFYTKQARAFAGQAELPALLETYPALDGGTFGHWGLQDDEDWVDTRWRDADRLPMMSGVLHPGPFGAMPKAIVVQMDRYFTSAFDTANLFFSYTTGGAFVTVGTGRHGFLDGLRFVSKGRPGWLDSQPHSPGSGKYLGLYRHGQKIIFHYTLKGEQKLDHAWSQDSLVQRDITGVKEGHLAQMAKGGPAQWPQWYETVGELGTQQPYAIDTLTLPQSTPWKHPWFISGIDFFSDGSAAFCTMTGDVWLLRGIDAGLKKLRFKRYASGLHQPLGLRILQDKVHVQGRDQITCLHDLNGDDEADYYQCITNDFATSSSGHDYITGCEYDGQRFYFASGNQGLCRILPGAAVEVLGTGFRNPNGLGLSREGEVTTSVQEGDWTPTSMIHLIQGPAAELHYGHKGPQQGKRMALPLVYLPRGVDNSSGGQCFAYSEKWGPLSDQLIHFSPGAAAHMLILRQKVAGLQQGAVVPLPGDFRSSVQQGRMHPQDGQLYVTGMTGWGSYAVADGCIQRVRYTGGGTAFPLHFSAHENGVLVRFSEAISPAQGRHFAQCWNYRYSAAYGSLEYSLKHPDTAGHDSLPIVAAHLLEEGKALFLEIPLLTPAHVIHLHLALAKEEWRDLYLTAHALAPDFTAYPQYVQQQKRYLQPESSSTATAITLKPSPWTQGQTGRSIELLASLGLQFSSKELRAKPGERLSLTFRNPDAVPHNWVLLAPGQLSSVGKQVDQMIADPTGLSRHYVPDSPSVLVWSPMVQPTESTTLHFTAPTQSGSYPYLCTFPGHWLAMNGVLKVE